MRASTRAVIAKFPRHHTSSVATPLKVRYRNDFDHFSVRFRSKNGGILQVRGTFDEHGFGGWNLEIVLRAAYLATHTLDASLQLARRVADSFGRVSGSGRLRRVDCAADFMGFDLANVDPSAFVTQRSKISEFRAEAKDVGDPETALHKPALRVHYAPSSKVTGFAISAGNPISARIYNKTHELNMPGREEKRAIEHERWNASGWDGVSSVTRVEFQFRGEFLDEVDLREPERLPLSIDSLWQRGVRWVRLIRPHTATRRKRCELDARWLAVQDVCFLHEAAPVVRVRRRGGASAAHVFGAALSRVAAAGRLPRINPPTNQHGEKLEGARLAAATSEEFAKEFCIGCVVQVFDLVANDVCNNLATRYGGWQNAMARLWTRNNAAVARFSSVDDPPARGAA